jgi:replicative DNA helicase
MSTEVSHDAERSVLGLFLIDPKAFDEAMVLGLTSDDFSLESHRKIFTHCCLLAETSSNIDLLTVVTSLDRTKELTSVGDASYVADLLMGLSELSSIKSYVRIVKEHAAQRKIDRACLTVQGQLAEGVSSAEAISYLTDQMLQVQSGSDTAPARRVLEFSDQTYARWSAVADGDSDLIGLSTGVPSLDLSTTGIREKELWVIGGRTGDGKTNLALQMLAANCRQDIPTGIFSIEMPKESLLHRLWAGEGQINFNHIRFPRRLSVEVKMQIQRAMMEVARWPLHVVEESNISISKLLAKARLLIRRENVKLIVVDYVQLINANGREERERITKISKALQSLAKDTGVPVIALSQLTRPKDGNENNRPVKYNLKESGSLENDPDVIILIYRPVDDRKMKTGEDELIVEKQRSGLPSIERVAFLPWLRFAEREMSR